MLFPQIVVHIGVSRKRKRVIFFLFWRPPRMGSCKTTRRRRRTILRRDWQRTRWGGLSHLLSLLETHLLSFLESYRCWRLSTISFSLCLSLIFASPTLTKANYPFCMHNKQKTAWTTQLHNDKTTLIRLCISCKIWTFLAQELAYSTVSQTLLFCCLYATSMEQQNSFQISPTQMPYHFSSDYYCRRRYLTSTCLE